MLTTVFIAGPKTTVMIKYWELLSISVSVKEASCGTVCAGVRRCCFYNKFSGLLIGIRRRRGRLLKKARATRGAYWRRGAISNFYVKTSFYM